MYSKHSYFKNILSIALFSMLLLASSCKGTKGNTKIKEDDYKTTIFERYKELMDATSILDIDKVIELTHPKLYKIVTKEQMRVSMNDIFSSLKMITDDLKIEKYSPLYEFEGEKYVLLDYTAKMTIINEDENMDIGTFAEIMGISYGKENVSKVDDKTILIDVKGKSTFAITSKEDGKWYFLENNQENPYYNQLIPVEIQEKFETE